MSYTSKHGNPIVYCKVKMSRIGELYSFIKLDQGDNLYVIQK
jgi:hypothetical protein